MDGRDFQQRAAKIEALVEEIEGWQDSGMRTKIIELLQALLQFYGEGLARLIEIVAQRDATLPHVLARDELIAHLLLLHGLHPLPVERRVAMALEDVRPYLQAHGGTVELVSLEGGVARVRLRISCHGSLSSTAALKQAIADAMQQTAPDLEGIVTTTVTELPLVPPRAIR
jgi:Fe-S cluster biogenesis protein NfuA